MNDNQLITAALNNGWDAERASLCDEEGSDGWVWTAPDGIEYTCVGSWCDPVIDNDDIRHAIRKTLESKLE